jgi:hypothetical protein
MLTGDGNLDRLIPPELRGSENWDILPAQERRRHAESQRFFVYTLVPRLPGKLLTPAIRFSTFDPATKQFARVEFKPVEVFVTGNAPAKVDLVDADPAAPAAAAPKPVTGLATPEPGRSPTFFRGTPAAPLAASGAFWSGNGLLLGGLLALTGALAFFGYLAAHPEIGVRRRARGIIDAALGGPATDRSLVRALQVGVAAVLGAEADAMTRSDVERVLPDAPRALLDALFARAYGDRFAPAATGGETTETEAARALLRRLRSLL